MNPTIRTTLTTALIALPCAFAFAAKDADLKPALAKRGKLVVEDAFAAAALPKTWTVAKGDWQVVDGAIVGKEKKEDQHAAVLALGQPNHNSIIRLSFKLDGTKGFALSFDHAKGHLFRVSLAADGITINKDKDKKDPNSKVVALGKCEGKFEKGQWYTMLVEVQGTKVAVQTDNGAKVEGSNPELNVAKTGYRFVMTGESLVLDDVKVWEAQP